MCAGNVCSPLYLFSNKVAFAGIALQRAADIPRTHTLQPKQTDKPNLGEDVIEPVPETAC